MNRLYPKREEQNENHQKMGMNEKVLGLDLDEQEMNGLYGMPETDLEDKMHKKM